MPIFNNFENFVNIGSRLEHFENNENNDNNDNNDDSNLDIGALTAKTSIQNTIDKLLKRVKELETKVAKLEASR